MVKDFTLNGLDFSPEINLARYLQSIRKFPILTPEEEYSLATKYKETQDRLSPRSWSMRICVWWLKSFPNIAVMGCLSAK